MLVAGVAVDNTGAARAEGVRVPRRSGAGGFLTMAAEECEGIRFDGTLRVAVEDAINPDWPPNFFADSRMVGRTRFGTTGCYPEPRLWIGSPRMCFWGPITAIGDDRVREWQAGFLQ